MTNSRYGDLWLALYIIALFGLMAGAWMFSAQVLIPYTGLTGGWATVATLGLTYVVAALMAAAVVLFVGLFVRRAEQPLLSEMEQALLWVHACERKAQRCQAEAMNSYCTKGFEQAMIRFAEAREDLELAHRRVAHLKRLELLQDAISGAASIDVLAALLALEEEEDYRLTSIRGDLGCLLCGAASVQDADLPKWARERAQKLHSKAEALSRQLAETRECVTTVKTRLRLRENRRRRWCTSSLN
jgi:hypothetical protein